MSTRSSARPFTLSAIVAACVVLQPAAAQDLGMVADNGSKSVIVFDADTLETLASISLGSSTTLADCVISPQYGLGFAADFRNNVWVVDLLADPPALAAGTNPVVISNPGEDLAVTADGRFVVVTDGVSVMPVCVIDVEARVEVSTLGDRASHVAVDVTADGSVLEVSRSRNIVRRLTIDSAGLLSNTNESLSFQNANNVYGAPGGDVGVVIGRNNRVIASFAVQGMTIIESRAISGTGVSAVFNASGDTLYVLSTSPGTLDVFDFDAATGFFSAGPVTSVALGSVPTLYGSDLLAMHPDGSMLYVSQPGEVSVFDATDLTYLGAVADAAIQTPTGVCIANLGPDEPENQPPVITSHGPMLLWPPKRKLVDVSGVLAIEDPDGDDMVVSVAAYSDESEWSRWKKWCGGYAPDFVDEWYEGGDGLLLRAERDYFGNGRVYVLVVSADDGNGGMTQQAVLAAIVPRRYSFWSRAQVLTEGELRRAEVQTALDLGQPVPEELFQLGLGEPCDPLRWWKQFHKEFRDKWHWKSKDGHGKSKGKGHDD